MISLTESSSNTNTKWLLVVLFSNFFRRRLPKFCCILSWSSESNLTRLKEQERNPIINGFSFRLKQKSWEKRILSDILDYFKKQQSAINNLQPKQPLLITHTNSVTFGMTSQINQRSNPCTSWNVIKNSTYRGNFSASLPFAFNALKFLSQSGTVCKWVSISFSRSTVPSTTQSLNWSCTSRRRLKRSSAFLYTVVNPAEFWSIMIG